MYCNDSSIGYLICDFEILFCVGTLIPDGTVSVECGNAKSFICNAPYYVPIGWNITGLNGINVPGPFNARTEHLRDLHDRFSSNDTGGIRQTRVSVITISRFSLSDNGGIIQCVNMDNNSTRGIAIISVGEAVGYKGT